MNIVKTNTYELTDFQFSNRHVTSSFKSIPTLHHWMVAANFVDGDAALGVNRAIMEYHQADNAFKRAFVLKELYLALELWLAYRPASTTAAATKRNGLVQDLYKRVVLELCGFFQVPVNMLQVKLEQVFKEMNQHRIHAGEQHLTVAEREQSRLVFEGSRIKRYSQAVGGFDLADTRANELGMLGLRADAPPQVEGEAGYVMSPWDGIYLARHDDHHFHSQYMGGREVVCAGDITIHAGQLIRVSNNSGHYEPEAERLVNVLWCFRKNQVNIAVTEVAVYVDDDHFYMCRAPDFLRAGGARPANARRFEFQNGWKEIR